MKTKSPKSTARTYLVKLFSVPILLGVALLIFVYAIVPHLPPPVDHEQIAREKIAQAAEIVLAVAEDWRQNQSPDHSYPSWETLQHLLRGKVGVTVFYPGHTCAWSIRACLSVSTIGEERQFIKVEGYDNFGRVFVKLGNA